MKNFITFFLIILLVSNCAHINNIKKIDPAYALKTEAETYQKTLPKNHIPIVINEQVAKYIKIYTTGSRKHLLRVLQRAHKYFYMMKKTFRDEGLPEELVYLPIIESGFNVSAYSPKHASGPWQFVKYTGKIYGLHSNWWLDERRSPEKSTIAAAKHLKDLYRWLKDWYLALAAYNAGGGKISRAIKKYKTRNFWELIKGKRRYLKKETKRYVPKFIAVTVICENLDKFNFTNIANEDPVMFETVEIPDATDLNLIAESCNTTFEKIKELNPELRRWATPPGYYNYKLRIPYGTKNLFLSNYNKIPPEERITFRRHKIKKGESIWSIAAKYKIPRDMIIKMNKLTNPRRIREGKYLIIPIQGLSKAREFDKQFGNISKTEENKIDY